uniref:Uncharacterized protein LOC111116066 n=1 Tax=Crassostrea virginica TaxID=6565 RepID=A0A8B8C7G0_CRAVI|nr:uncharacterized protein LOC111116066 [Crassostrea virginica]
MAKKKWQIYLCVYFAMFYAGSYNKAFVRCVCLQNALSYFYSNTACKFSMEEFKSTFTGIHGGCLSNCSLISTGPTLERTKTYRIKTMMITFSQYLFKRLLKKPCESSYRAVSVSLRCEGNYIYELGQNDSCIEHDQCIPISKSQKFTCDIGLTNETNDLQESSMWRLKTCLPARGFNKTCIKSEQCQQINLNSTCNVDRGRCECQQGFIQTVDKCIKAPKLGESCDETDQCALTNKYSTCNKTLGVCQCPVGYLKIFNTCSQGRVLLKEICESYRLSGDNTQIDIKNICSSLSMNISNLLREPLKKDNPGVIVGVGLAGLFLGIVICGVVEFIITRRLKKMQYRQEKIDLQDVCKETRIERVQVSENVNSRSIVSKRTAVDPEENNIYNHLHENPGELYDQENTPEYDHCPPRPAVEDLYSHLASTTSGDYIGDYGEVN